MRRFARGTGVRNLKKCLAGVELRYTHPEPEGAKEVLNCPHEHIGSRNRTGEWEVRTGAKAAADSRN